MTANRERRMLLAGIGAVGALAITRTARAATCGDIGPLGPTGPTMRNVYDKIALTDQGLAEARTPIPSLTGSVTAQYSITAAGVYYMTGNITGVSGKSAIEVLADNVEIECDGFVFLGVPGTLACIRAPGAQRCIGIYDAGFSQWQETCIDLSSSTDCYVEETWFERCDASSNPAGLGACALGTGGIIDDCNVLNCTHGLLSVGANGVIEECVSRNSTGGCFSSIGPAVMEDNFALNNDGASMSVFNGSVVIGNRVVACGGIDVGPNSVVSENDLSDCTGPAISVHGSRCTVEENHISGGTVGIRVQSPSDRVLIDGNHVAGGSDTGILVEAGASRCLVVRNAVSPPVGVTSYDIPAGNSYGPVVSVIGVGDIGAGGTLTDPWSNFEY